MRIGLFYLLFILVPLSTSGASSRADILARDIRCPVCAGQSLADSENPLAIELRRQIDVAIANGASDSEILDAFSRRYGEDVILRPPFQKTTWFLWGAPFFVFLISCFIFIRRMRRIVRFRRWYDS